MTHGEGVDGEVRTDKGLYVKGSVEMNLDGMRWTYGLADCRVVLMAASCRQEAARGNASTTA